jgi:CheY-like chemotaxis protein
LSDALYTYLYLFEFEVIISLFSTGRFEPAYQYCNRVMLRKMVIGDGAMKQLSHFKSYCIEHIKDRFIEYDPEKVAQITARTRRSDMSKQQEQKDRAMAAGFDHYLVKPILGDELLALIAHD